MIRAFIEKYLFWIKLGAVVAALIYAGVKINQYGDYRYDKGKTDQQAIQAKADEDAKKKASEKEAEWQRKVSALETAALASASELQKRADGLLRADHDIRLCLRTSSEYQHRAEQADAIAKSNAVAVVGGPAVPTREDSGANIYPDLVQYGRDAEACRQQVIELQSYIRATQ